MKCFRVGLGINTTKTFVTSMVGVWCGTRQFYTSILTGLTGVSQGFFSIFDRLAYGNKVHSSHITLFTIISLCIKIVI